MWYCAPYLPHSPFTDPGLEFKAWSKWYTSFLLHQGARCPYLILMFTGVFLLFDGGWLALCCSQPLKAIEFYTKAHQSQSHCWNLHHISFCEIAIANFCLWDIPASLVCWWDLQVEASVSPWSQSWLASFILCSMDWWYILVCSGQSLLFSWDSCLLTWDRQEGECGESTETSSEDCRQVYTP